MGHVYKFGWIYSPSPLTTMPNTWRVLPVFLSVLSAYASSQSFENTAIVRTIELGGSVVHVTTTYAIKALENGLNSYTLALGSKEQVKTSWLEVTVKGDKKPLAIKQHGLDNAKYVISKFC